MSISERFKPTIDIPSPRDIIKQKDIEYYEVTQTVEIEVKPPIWLTTVADTNSMDATVDAGHTCILTGNFEHKDLMKGDIVVYYISEKPTGILHRIVKIEQDEQGRKYVLKGDNNYRKDPYVIRDGHIRWLLVGIIY